MEISFILYKPATPGNIGAAARALNTMGFSDLRLINPCDHLSGEALTLAHGSAEILRNAKVYHNIEECSRDLDFLIGTTAKSRSVKKDFISCHKIREFLEDKGNTIHKAGILFGTEESGLPNQILKACDMASSIPMKNPYPSINLGQAVMLYSYELSGLSLQEDSESEETNSFPELKSRIQALLTIAGIHDRMPVYFRIMERISHLNSGDINLMNSVSSRLIQTVSPKQK